MIVRFALLSRTNMGQGSTAGNIAIIAGRGSLPRELSAHLKQEGSPPFFVGIENEHEDWLLDERHEILHWGQFGRLFKLLQENKITKVAFAGSMTRPRLDILKMDWGAITSLPQILAFMLGGDNSLFKGVIRVFERHGIEIVGVHELMPDLLANSGVISGRKPGKKAHNNMMRAFEACKMLGTLDIGQAAVAVGGRVIAVEGIEGTDLMLARVADLRRMGRLSEDGKHGVLVKTMKPGQEMRVDLPAIGPDTVKAASEAGLAGICVEAKQSIILARSETTARAKDTGVFIFGANSVNQGQISE